jgi:protein transport protein SEC24
MTTYNLPHSDDLALASQLPLGLVVQPFALLRDEEGSVPVVDAGDVGPARCQRCRGYINAWCVFIEGGQKFICNLCGASTEGELGVSALQWKLNADSHFSTVTPEYFSHLDMSQRRMDLDQRPELQFGSVDFVVGKEYWVQDNPTSPGASPREPTPLHYIFAIDVSWTSVRCGLIKEVVKGLRELLYPTEEEVAEGRSTGLPAEAKIAIMTFDRTVQFFNLKVSFCSSDLSSTADLSLGQPGLDQAQMLVVPDITDMFMPINEGFLADPIESRCVSECATSSFRTDRVCSAARSSRAFSIRYPLSPRRLPSPRLPSVALCALPFSLSCVSKHSPLFAERMADLLSRL